MTKIKSWICKTKVIEHDGRVVSSLVKAIESHAK